MSSETHLSKKTQNYRARWETAVARLAG